MRNPTFTTSLLLTLLVAPAARAATNNFVQLQMSSAKVGAIIDKHLALDARLCPEQVPCGGNSTCWMDHIELVGNGVWGRGMSTSTPVAAGATFTTTEIVYTRPIAVHTKTNSCAATPGCTTTTAHLAGLEMVVRADPNSNALCFSANQVVGLGFPYSPPPEERCVGLDTASLTTVFGANAQATGRGVSLSNNGSRLALRVQLDRPVSGWSSAEFSAWQSFLNGALGTSTGSLDWSWFVHQSLLEGAVRKTIEDATGSGSKIARKGSISTAWTNLGASGGRASASTGAKFTDCAHHIDLSPLTADVDFGLLPGGNGLRLSGFVDWHVDQGDAVLCGITKAGPLGIVLGPVVANSFGLQQLGSAMGGCVTTGDHTFYCDEQTHPIDLPVGAGATMKLDLDTVQGAPNGLVFGGPATLTGGVTSDLNVSLKRVTFGHDGKCNGAFCGYKGGMYLSGSARLCSVDFAPDPAYHVESPQSLSLPASWIVTMNPGAVPPNATSYPGPVATVRSSDGIQTYQLPPTLVQAYQGQQIDPQLWCAVLDVKNWASNCLEPLWKPFEQRFHPEWVIDPWERPAIIYDVFRGVEIGYALLDTLRIEAIHPPRSELVSGISLQGRLQVMVSERNVQAQDVFVQVELPRGRTARSLAEAVRMLERGVSAEVELVEALVPRGVESAYVALNVDQDLLMDLVEGGR